MSAERLRVEDLRRFCADALPSPSELERTMINEAAFGLSRIIALLAEHPTPSPRLLEVGGGHLILSAYLACRGFDVTTVEPLGEAFTFFGELHHGMLERARAEGGRLTVLRCVIEEVDAREAFDVAFSINAFEHMADPYVALDVMHRALRPGGRLLVHCPNYDVPFESHFGLWLITLSKALNERVYRKRIDQRRACWDGLTFVRFTALRRHCAARHYDVRFNRAMLQDAFVRLREDAVFSERMPKAIRVLGRLVTSPRVAACLTRVPLRFQTPMELVLHKPNVVPVVASGIE